MRRIAVVPSDPLEDYIAKGLGGMLGRYYGLKKYFDEVFVLSPLETRERMVEGLSVIPTSDRELPGRVRALGVDLVRAYGGNWPCDMVCRFRPDNVPVVVSLHDRREPWFRPSLRRADLVIAVSEEVRGKALGLGLSPAKVIVLPNGIDLAVFRPMPPDRARWSFPSGKKVVLFIGRLSPEKNIEGIIRAFGHLDEEYIFVAAGGGDAQLYEKAAAAAGVLGRCRFLGAVSRQDLPGLINAADVVCNPSHSEAMSLALIEAMACGAAIVTSDVAARGVALKDRVSGFVVRDEKDPASIAKAVREACEEAPLREAVRAGARDAVRPFSLARVEAREIALYEELMFLAGRGKMHRPFWDTWPVLRER